MIPTPHISALKEDIAETVIMPGDPLRSKMIAETFMENPRLINNVRGVQGYTGYYKNKKFTVMASGMGNPSMGIYSYELFNDYDVKKIIRVGSMAAFKEEIKLLDVIITNSTLTNTNYNNFFINNGESFVKGSDRLLAQAVQVAKDLGKTYYVGSTLCSDTFYTDEDELAKARKYDLLAVEMEAAALFINAKRLNKEALVIGTISNHIITKEETTSLERQNAFTDMIKIALELI